MHIYIFVPALLNSVFLIAIFFARKMKRMDIVHIKGWVEAIYNTETGFMIITNAQ